MKNSGNPQIITDADRLTSAKNMREYFKSAKSLLGGTVTWKVIEIIKKNGAKKYAEKIFDIPERTTDSFDRIDKKEAEGLVKTSRAIKECIKKGENQEFFRALFFPTLGHLMDFYKIRKDIKDLDIEKDIMPRLSFDMFLPFFVFFTLMMGDVWEELDDIKKKEDVEKFYAILLGVWDEIEEMIGIELLINSKNKKRKNQIKELLDIGHDKVTDAYYDAIEGEEDIEKIKNKMLKLIERDPDFFDPYMEAVDILFEEDKDVEAWKLLEEGFKRAMMRIVDSKGRWPKSMSWGYLKNRHLVRMIDRYAYELWSMGRRGHALDIYRKLLESNPNDNVGARYNILAILMGFDAGEVEDNFPADTPGFVNVIEMDNWFYKNAPDYPEDLKWWLDGNEE
ncbi:MAG TPA: hypothetical protein PKU93_02935 [Candidatus Pacearchaeota archaeon]|nr:hypothetical protein [Candidatus Pacearchaeota archaeon]